MPYTEDTVPDHVPKAAAKRWAGAWNGAYTSCKKDGRSDKDCEGYAFRVANATLKEMGKVSKKKRLVLRATNLTSVVDAVSKAFEATFQVVDPDDGYKHASHYPMYILDDAVIARGRYTDPFEVYRVPYQAGADGTYTFAPREAWEGGHLVFEAGMARAVGGFRVFRAADGRRAWVSWSASGYLARDRRYISTEALAREVARKEGKSRGPLLLAHLPRYRVGECLFGHVAGRILVEAGVFDDTPWGRAAADYFEKTDAPHTVSIRWLTPMEAFRDGVFHEVDIEERSVLPLGREADIVTQFSSLREGDMDWKKNFVAKILGEEAAAEVEHAIQEAQAQSAELDAAGVPARAAPETGEVKTEAARDAEAVLTKPAAGVSAEQLAAMLAGAVEVMGEQVSAALQAQAEAQGRALAEGLAPLAARLEQVERALGAPSEARAMLFDALRRSASSDPSTALDLRTNADKALRKDTVGAPEHLFDKVRQ